MGSLSQDLRTSELSGSHTSAHLRTVEEVGPLREKTLTGATYNEELSCGGNPGVPGTCLTTFITLHYINTVGTSDTQADVPESKV